MTTRRLATLWLLAGSGLAHAQRVLHIMPTREGVTTTLFWQAAPHAQATVLLFPGGGGGFGRIDNGEPSGNNFLVRSAVRFRAHGLNVAIFGRPSDSNDLGFADRIDPPHLQDVRAVLDFIRAQSALPIWLVGTSRGTISATAATIHMPDAVAGLVLTSSVVSHRKAGAVPTQDLSAIRVPVLLLHHARDACKHCLPHEVPSIVRGLIHAPIKRQIMVSGGADPQGDVCGPWHWHGFAGMEEQVVNIIAAWIKQPG
jgi:hypothetical protein